MSYVIYAEVAPSIIIIALYTVALHNYTAQKDNLTLFSAIKVISTYDEHNRCLMSNNIGRYTV